jgi:hypothetical protein
MDDPGGSGIASYTIYVSDNSGTFTSWLTATTQTSATYVGLDGHTYDFFSVATDNVGNQEAIPTSAQATTTVDATTPTSTVAALPQFSPGSFTVTWSGSDANGVGIASYSVYVSDDGAAFTPWLTNTTQTSATYAGLNGHTYGFCSVATDNLGNVQPMPSAAQASTTVDTVAPTSIVAALPAFTLPTFTITWSGSDNPGGSGLASYDVFVSDNGGAFVALLTNTIFTSTTFTGINGHTYSFDSIATDNVGNQQVMPSTPQATTTVDATPPTSTVAALPAFSSAVFTVNWSGNDGIGSGIASYSVYVSDNGGIFTLLLTNTTQTSTTFTGVNGHTYGFYSVATDNVGNREPTPLAAEAVTRVDAVPPTSAVSPLPATTTATAFTVSWSGSDPGGSGLAFFDIFVSDDGGAYVPFLADTTQTSATFTGQPTHTYAFYSVATDYVGNQEAAPAAAQATIAVLGLSTITWPNPAAITYGTPLGATQLDATASAVVNGSSVSVAGTFTYTLANNTAASGAVLTAGQSQALYVSFTPSDPGEFTGATASAAITVNPATPVIASASAAGITYGTSLSDSQLSGSATWTRNGQTVSVPGSFTFGAVAGTVLGAGTYAETITFNPTDTADYTSATTTVTVSVAKATTTLSWANPADITYGTALNSAQLDATASVPGSFSYSPASGTVLGAGNNQALQVTFTPTDSTDYTTASDTVSLNVNQAIPIITWATPAAITYGTALSATQLDATANVAGTFVYSPVSGAVPGVGTQTLSATFTPTDATDYTKGSATVNLTVTPPPLIGVSAFAVQWGADAVTASLQTAADGVRLLPAGRINDLPWYDINKIDITLSQSATLNPGDVTVTGITLSNYGPVTITGSGANYVITLGQAIANADRVTVTINNSQIAKFTRRLDVLPGDVNDDNGVNTTDGLLIASNYTTSGHAYNVLYDYNGDGAVNSTDFTLYRPKIGTVMPLPPQLAADGEGPGGTALLTPAEAAPVLAAAINEWKAAGLPSADVARLNSVTILVTNLPAGYLGGTAIGSTTIYLSADAAGHGWFIGQTPWTNAAFNLSMGPTELLADPSGAAAGHEDLLTVVAHELGHTLGLNDLGSSRNSTDLMAELLATGVRRSPSALDVTAVLRTENTARPAATELATSAKVVDALFGSPFLKDFIEPSAPAYLAALLSQPAPLSMDSGAGGPLLPINGAAAGFRYSDSYVFPDDEGVSALAARNVLTSPQSHGRLIRNDPSDGSTTDLTLRDEATLPADANDNLPGSV